MYCFLLNLVYALKHNERGEKIGGGGGGERKTDAQPASQPVRQREKGGGGGREEEKEKERDFLMCLTQALKPESAFFPLLFLLLDFLF